MQYTLGTAAITSGGSVFVGDATVDWSDAKTEIDGGKTVWIKVYGSGLVYEVASITTPAANAGHTPASRWEANIVGVIGDPTNAAATYTLHWNFTPTIGLPIPNSGDVDVEAIIGRAFSDFDALALGGFGTPGGMSRGGVVRRSTVQTIPNNLVQRVSFDTELFDSGSVWDNTQPTRLVAPEAGLYAISGYVTFLSNTTGRRLLFLTVNNTSEIGRSEVATQNQPGGGHSVTVSALWSLNAGDYVELWVYQNITGGGSLDIIQVGVGPLLGMGKCSSALGGGPGGGNVATDTLWNVKGDLAVATGPDAADRLGVGTNGQVLTVDSGAGGGSFGVKWATPTSGTMANPMSAVGDLIVGTTPVTGGVATPTKIPISATDGQVLTVDSSVSGLKMKWAAPTGGMTNPMSHVGAIIIGGSTPSAGTPSELTAGAAGKVLRIVGTSPAWSDAIAADTIWTAKGDIVVATGNDVASVLGLGSAPTGYVLTVDTSLAQGVKWAPQGAASDPGQGYEDQGTKTGTATFAVGITGRRHKVKIALNQGATGAYTVAATLPRAGRNSGDTVRFTITFGASTTNLPTLEIWDLNTSTTRLWTFTGDAYLRKAWADFGYDSTATIWYWEAGGWLT